MQQSHVARQKVAGLHLRGHYLNQLPVIDIGNYDRARQWLGPSVTPYDWVSDRVLELTFTAWDLENFAYDCGWSGAPFVWDQDRRFLIRAELDAAYFHLYGLTRDDVNYVMDTFPIVANGNQVVYGEYLSKRVILGIYDRMQIAIDGGEPYETALDPPPGDPRAARAPLAGDASRLADR